MNLTSENPEGAAPDDTPPGGATTDVPAATPTPEAEGLLPAAAHWGAIHTKARTEKIVAEWLANRRIPHYLPLALRRHVYVRRVRETWVPLFPGYVFFDSAAIERRAVFDSRKVANVIVPRTPEVLLGDLRNLARALAIEPMATSRPLTAEGTPVEVVSGPLLGTRGRLVRPGPGALLVISVDFIGFGAEITIDEACVRAA